MKKRLTWGAACLALGAGSACAVPYQDVLLAAVPEFNGGLKEGVALYGSVDMGINYQSVGGRSTWQTQSGGEWTWSAAVERRSRTDLFRMIDTPEPPTVLSAISRVAPRLLIEAP